jgi:hypothetical protein|tara:strand:+ start:76 stop:471 length:396 start_codon:yes stop_codon:yes gene_type:complete
MNIKHIAMNYDKVLFLACNDISKDLKELNAFDIEAIAIDYDPKFKDIQYYINKDFVFDDLDLDTDLTIHMNVEKTYPLKLSGDVILRGDNEQHNGDCCPITSCDQLIKLFGVNKIYEKSEQDNHFFVYGCI